MLGVKSRGALYTNQTVHIKQCNTVLQLAQLTAALQGNACNSHNAENAHYVHSAGQQRLQNA